MSTILTHPLPQITPKPQAWTELDIGGCFSWENESQFIADTVDIVKPNSILEIGFFAGASSFMWLELSKARLTSVDPMVNLYDANEKHTGKLANVDNLKRHFGQERFKFIQKDSKVVRPDLEDTYDLMFIDGDHWDKGIRNDFDIAIEKRIPWVLVDDFVTSVEQVYFGFYQQFYDIVRVYPRKDQFMGKPIPIVLLKLKETKTTADSSVEGFFSKNAADGYAKQYDIDHGPRLDAMLETFKLKNMLGTKILDVGGGLGFLGKRLDCDNNDYWVVDGAEVSHEQRLARGTWVKTDLDYSQFAGDGEYSFNGPNQFDIAFCLETLEHLTNPYNCIAEIKKLVKPNGIIYISIPHENVWHNAIYPGLLWPEQNWEQFLGQMALPIIEKWTWTKGWNSRHWKLRNAPWEEANMLYKKDEPKFRGKTPVEYVNL
jgi:2-polyprenyl-3-methyl-5-hydroxy-6-metoxy-1,4-benzoquinol methylase